MRDYFKRVSALTPTKFWINNVSEEEANLAIEHGAVGCTQNPSYVWKMMQDPTQKSKIDKMIEKYHNENLTPAEIETAIQRDLVKEICQIFMPLYTESNGACGYVSIQGNPFNEDYESLVKYAEYNYEASPNIMAKIPVTPSGLRAISYLLKKGIAINATEVFSVSQAMELCKVYKEATKDMAKKPVCFYSHISGIFDEYLAKQVETNKCDISKDILWQAGIAAAKKTYRMTKALYPDVGFIGGGARGLHHFKEMVGADACITINWKGTADKLIEEDAVVLDLFDRETPHYVIDELLKLEDFRKAYNSYELSSEEYEEFGPVGLFRTMFEDAWVNAEEYISSYLK